MIFKVLTLVLAILGFYLSPYGPGTGPNASETVEIKTRRIVSGTHYLATVTRVADGDTITVRNTDGATHKIRMHAIDAPELKQAGGEQARRWLSNLLMNQQVKILVNDTDRYQRQVAKVLLPIEGCTEPVCAGETDVNLKALENGHAWWYRDFARTQSSEDRSLYENAEQLARETRTGLWQQANPKAPWQWRTEQRNQQNN